MSTNLQSNDNIVQDGKHPTGIKILDEEELRGIPKGTTVSIIGPPESGAELFLYALANTGRDTEYIVTTRSHNGLLSDIQEASQGKYTKEELQEFVNVKDLYSSSKEFNSILAKALNDVGGGNLIIETFSKFYNKPDSLLENARKIQEKTRMNNGLTYLYFAVDDVSELTREEKEVCQISDAVFEIKKNITGGNKVENYLYINKLRRDKVPEDGQSLTFGKNVSIEISSNIR